MHKPLDHIEQFIADVRADADLAPSADEIAKAMHALDQEADGNDHAAALFEAMLWVVRQPRSAAEKFAVIYKLVDQKGFVYIPSIREFAGWKWNLEQKEN